MFVLKITELAESFVQCMRNKCNGLKALVLCDYLITHTTDEAKHSFTAGSVILYYFLHILQNERRLLTQVMVCLLLSRFGNFYIIGLQVETTLKVGGGHVSQKLQDVDR